MSTQSSTLIVGDCSFCYHNHVNRQQRQTLVAIFATPTPSTLEWRKIEALFIALGAVILEGRGSRVRF